MRQMLPGVGQRALDAVGLGIQFEQRRMLRLPAGAAMVNDERLRDAARQVRAEILLDHGQRQVDAGGHAGRRPDVPSMMKMRSSSTLHAGKPRLKLARISASAS